MTSRLTPSTARQQRMLALLREKGLVMAGPDQQVLRYLELRRQARALPLHGISGKTSPARAWQITDAGVAASLRLAEPRRRSRRAEPEQIDIEAAIAASSGERPVSPPLTDPDAPTVPAAGVSAPEGRSSRRSARGRQPETATP